MTHEHADRHAPEPDAAPRWDAAFWDERYGSSAALWSGHVNAVVGRPPRPGAVLTAEELDDDLRSGPGSWEVVVTAEAGPRPGRHPDGHPVVLHDTVLRARRRDGRGNWAR